MAPVDYAILLIYFVIVIGVGFFYSRYASRDLKSYFLGGQRLPWLALAMSGSVSTFDITGTMWIVSVIYILGFKSMWHHWMWGFLMAAFFLSYMGKWVRRSNVITAAEWMITRFDNKTPGKTARLAYAIMAVLTLTAFIGYAYQGIGKFAAVYIPLDNLANYTSSPFLQNLVTTHEHHVLAIAVMSITTFYVLVGGLYSVVVTDVIQTVILTLGCIFIAWIAWSRLTPELLATLPPDFTSMRVPWKLPELAGTDNAYFVCFGPLVLIWIVKGLLLNAGGPGQMYDFQRFLAARTPEDAAKIGAAWSLFLIVRWAMTLGIALLAITGAVGVTDSEKVMPLVLREFLPVGIRGLVIAGLLAAFMSTFSSIVNSGAAFIVRDIWQPYMRPNATDHQAVRFSYFATLFVVVVGIAIGFQAKSISQIWNWIMMALGSGVIIPNVLRWYWWRYNGWGYALGTFGGIVASLVVLFLPDLPIYIAFPIIVGVSLIASLITTWLTSPVDNTVLINFYRTVRPFGLWRPIKQIASLSADEQNKKSESFSLTIVNLLLSMLAIFGAYVGPMYLVGHWYRLAAAWLAVSAAAVITLYFTWYRPCIKNPA